MFALHAFARSAPRAIARVAAAPARASLSAGLRRTAIAAPWKQPISARITAQFSTSTFRRSEELVAKLQSEIDVEQTMRNQEQSLNIREFLDSSEFKLLDVEGNEEVILTRKYNDETIKVTFTIDDLNNLDQDQDEADELAEEAFDDEGTANELLGEQSGGANTKGAVNRGKARDGNVRVAPEDRVAPADRPELEDEEDVDAEEAPRDQSFPCQTTISIERPGKGALQVQALAQDGDILIQNVHFFANTEAADPQTAEKDWERRALYTGPQFGTLDEDLQVLIQQYLEARGIDTRLAMFIPDYVDFKEQKEYLRWLAGVKNFVDVD